MLYSVYKRYNPNTKQKCYEHVIIVLYAHNIIVYWLVEWLWPRAT